MALHYGETHLGVTDIFGDARLADVILLTGTNTTANHPVAATFFKEATRRGTKLIVVDPRRPDIANFATFYCRTNPGTDVAFYNAVMHVLIAEGLYDEDFVRDRTENFEALRDLVLDYAPERMAPVCGIDSQTIRAVARTISAPGRSSSKKNGVDDSGHSTNCAPCAIASPVIRR